MPTSRKHINHFESCVRYNKLLPKFSLRTFAILPRTRTQWIILNREITYPVYGTRTEWGGGIFACKANCLNLYCIYTFIKYIQSVNAVTQGLPQAAAIS